MLISPTEPKELHAIGTVSWKPENYGADILIRARNQWIGVQRKAIPDLLNSIQDKRLGMQVSQLVAGVDTAVLVVEGKMRWTLDGELMEGAWQTGSRKPWTREALNAVLWGVRAKGIWVDWTDDVRGTVEYVQGLERWARKGKHGSLEGREGPSVMWGKAGNGDYQRHLLMGMPGVGVELAGRIVSHFGGLPWRWADGITVEKLMEVEGVGKKKAEAMMRVFESQQ